MPDHDALLAGSLERGHVALRGGVEIEPARVHQHHRRGREAHDLGQRCQVVDRFGRHRPRRSEEHTSELQYPTISYAVFCLKKKKEIGEPSSSSSLFYDLLVMSVMTTI